MAKNSFIFLSLRHRLCHPSIWTWMGYMIAPTGNSGNKVCWVLGAILMRLRTFCPWEHLLSRSKHHTAAQTALMEKVSWKAEAPKKVAVVGRWQIGPTPQLCPWALLEINLPPDAISNDGPYLAKPYPKYRFMSKAVFENTTNLNMFYQVFV